MSIVEQMLAELPFSKGELLLLIATAPARYKIHMIQKRKGGQRVIAQPTAEIKLLQRWVIDKVLSQLPLHPAAVAYRKGGSTRNHAIPHVSHRYLLKLDFKDFFPSISATAFAKHVATADIGLSAEDVYFLCNILFYKNKSRSGLFLSIGAPSSPSVSNTMMYSFDEAVSLFCLAHGVTYTRYADDLAFSTNEPKTLDIVGEYVAGLCAKSRDLKLKLNTAKTVNVSNKFRRELTGIILANDGRTTLGREKRRMIRAMVDYFARGKLSDDEVTYLRGLIAYARSIDQTIINLVRKRLTNEQMSKLI